MTTLLEHKGKNDGKQFTYVQPYPDAGKLPRWLAPLAPTCRSGYSVVIAAPVRLVGRALLRRCQNRAASAASSAA
jgi:hypothetical protein